MQETYSQSLNWEDPLEKQMTTHSSILAWEIPWTEEPSKLQSMGLQKSQTRFCDYLKFVFLVALVLSQHFLEFFFKRIFVGLPRGLNG